MRTRGRNLIKALSEASVPQSLGSKTQIICV